MEAINDGIVARVIDRTFENPAMTGGLLVMALTATAIVSNAMFLQRGSHPDPLFKTRPAVAQSPTKVVVPAPPPVRPDRVVASPPMPHLAPQRSDGAAQGITPQLPPAPAPASRPTTAAAPPDTAATTVSKAQRDLARLGFYSGPIDGMAGARTTAAIRAFEMAAGRPVTGVATADLLAAMKLPLPAPTTRTEALPAPSADAEAAELDRRERARAEAIAAQERQQAQDRMQSNLRIAQAALNRIGYGPLPVNGNADVETVEAIRRFELDNGMPITGEASDGLIARLISIGAVKPG